MIEKYIMEAESKKKQRKGDVYMQIFNLSTVDIIFTLMPLVN